MSAIRQEVESLIGRMDSLETVEDDLFIQFYEKVGDLQERIGDKYLMPEFAEEERNALTDSLTEAFERMKGKMSFCNLG